MRLHGQPDRPPGRQPTETRVDTVKVECGRTGPEVVPVEYESCRQHTIADVEAWCVELRRLGAPDDLPLPEADGLTVTIDGSQDEDGAA